MIDKLDLIGEKVINCKEISHEEALIILRAENRYLFHLLAWVNSIRQIFAGNEIDLCSVIGARSGECSEDCSFCSQSIYYSTGIASYPLLSIDIIVEGARKAKSYGATKFCLATSGAGFKNKKELSKICEAVERIRNEVDIEVCATLGALTIDEMSALKTAGLSRFHHNLETAESYFSTICTTHTYQDRIRQIMLARDMGLSTCSGGIFGMGESIEQRVELAFAIRALAVDSVPINFLMSVPGTPLEGTSCLLPIEALKTIALFRFLMPDKEIRVCGGRITALRDLHPLIFASGASGMMIGDYLTRNSRSSNSDLQMLRDLGLKIVSV